MDLENMDYGEKQKLALNPSTPGDVLRELAKDENWIVRMRVAYNPNTPITILRELTKDKVESIRWSVVQNPNTPSAMLRDLLMDNNIMFRWKCALNPKSSSKILVTLFEYEKSLRKPDENAIKALYAHKNLPHIAKVIIETLFGELL